MYRLWTKQLLTGIVAIAIASGASVAEAGWWHHGSSGGSSGGYGGSSGGYGGSSGGWGGSSGGSSGGWYGGSSGGSSGGYRHHHHHRRAWGSSGGSSGGWGGSSGGSSGGWSGGSSGGGWSGGSSGGSAYYAPAVNTYYAPTYTTGTVNATEGTLAVRVPTDAKIYVNGKLTNTPGDYRKYVSKNLESGYAYNYEVRAEMVKNGQTVTETKSVSLYAGQTTELAFNFTATTTPVETTLTLHVPENAKVFLSGRLTKATGETRVYRSTAMNAGEVWDDYTVRIEFEENGTTVSREEKIVLTGGESSEMAFDANTQRLASR